jgi:hypothetical protein
MIVPTIGRVVLVHRGMSDQAEPAFVCYVHSDRLINVAGFHALGAPFSVTNIQLVQDDDEIQNPNQYAEWMPYQKAVATGAQAPVLHPYQDILAAQQNAAGTPRLKGG